MKLLTKRRNLKVEGIVIVEDITTDITKRLKDKPNVESRWFVNGKIKYKIKWDSRVKELRDWGDFPNEE